MKEGVSACCGWKEECVVEGVASAGRQRRRRGELGQSVLREVEAVLLEVRLYLELPVMG